jgi:hypothetical protein
VLFKKKLNNIHATHKSVKILVVRHRKIEENGKILWWTLIFLGSFIKTTVITYELLWTYGVVRPFCMGTVNVLSYLLCYIKQITEIGITAELSDTFYFITCVYLSTYFYKINDLINWKPFRLLHARGAIKVPIQNMH